MFNDAQQNKDGFYALLLFFIWPFLAAMSSLLNYKKHWAKNIFWIFIAFYGYTFAVGVDNQSADIVRYMVRFQQMHQVEMTFTRAIDYYLQSGEIDFVSIFISIVLSRFTENSAVLTLAYATIFGFFFSRNMWYVLEHLEGRLKPVTILLVICLFMVIPIWDFNGFRMWTAAHIFIYGLLPFLYEGKKTGLLISSTAILVHYSFIVPVLILVAYIVFGNRLILFFSFFLGSFFISEIDLDMFNQFVESYAPEILQERTSGYRGESYVESYRTDELESTRNWYAEWYGRGLKWFIMGSLVVIFLKGRDFFKENKGWLNLFSFTLLFYGTANLLSSLPSGGRFIAVANLSAMALIIFYQQNREQEILMKRFVLLASPALFLFLVVRIRMGLYSISATTVLGNPILAFFTTGENLSLGDVLRLIL
jgi:hypothetical protein